MKAPCLCLEKPHQAKQRGISTEPLGCGQVSGPPNYSDKDEKDRSKRYGQAGRREEHGPQSGLLLAASREVSGPTFKFSSTPARPGRPAAQARTKEGGGLSWPGLDLFSRSCQRPIFLLSTNSLPASDRNSIFPSLPFLFFYPSPLHSSKNFSIFDQSDIQNVAHRRCQGLGHAREYSQCLQPSLSPKNSLAPKAEAITSRASQHPSAINPILASIANGSRTIASTSLR